MTIHNSIFKHPLLVTLVGVIAVVVLTWYGVSEHYSGLVEGELNHITSSINALNGQVADINHHLKNLELAFAHSNPKVSLNTLEQISNITNNNYEQINDVLSAWKISDGNDSKVFQKQLLDYGLTNDQSLKITHLLYQRTTKDIKTRIPPPKPPK